METQKKRFFIDCETKQKVPYVTAADLKKKYPEGDYLAAAEICVGTKKEDGVFKAVLKEGVETWVQPIGTYSEKRYRTIGYIPWENNAYILLKKKKNPIPALLLLGILIAALCGGFYLLNKEIKNRADIDPNAEDYVSTLTRPENIEDTEILIPAYGEFVIKKGSDIIETTLYNPEGNPCYFRISLTLDETGEVLYESKLIPPGKGITNIKLNKVLEAGKYPVTLNYRSFDFEDTEIEYNGSKFQLTLTVKE